jgi:hypothetical protein
MRGQLQPFHGGNRGSNPLGDAIRSRNDGPLRQRSTISAPAKDPPVQGRGEAAIAVSGRRPGSTTRIRRAFRIRHGLLRQVARCAQQEAMFHPMPLVLPARAGPQLPFGSGQSAITAALVTIGVSAPPVDRLFRR